MGSKWRESTVGEETQIILGFAFKSSEFATKPPGYRLVRGDNVKRGTLEWGDKARFWPSITPDLEKYCLREGDILIGMDGSRVGENFACVSSTDLPALLVQRVACLRARKHLDQDYLRYVICNSMFTSYIKAVHTGTSIPHISGGQIASYPILVPPRNEQRAIAHILGTLDDKIELNRRMSETLEAMARALFQSWFVDFDPARAKMEGHWRKGESLPGLPAHLYDLFPDSFEKSELGEIPRGWQVQGIDEIANFLNGLALQKYPPGDGATLPVIKIAQLRKGDTDSADRCNTSVPPEFVINDSDVLFSWSGSLECILWAGDRGALNQHLFKVTSTQFPKWFYYLWVHQHLASFRRTAAGKATTMGHIQRHHLSDAKVVVPNSEVLGMADKIIAPIIGQVMQHRVESRTLATLRDTFLPKLITGELQIKVANDSIQEATA